MIGGEEILFRGAYRDFSLGVRFDLSGASGKDAAYALSYISEKIEGAAFRLSGIDTGKVDSFAVPSGTGLTSVASFFQSNPQSRIRDALLAACPDANLLPAAESRLMNSLLRKAGVPFSAGGIPSALKPVEERPEGQIMFVGKFGGWIAIKKLSLESVADWEVSAVLCGINHTAISKAFDFCGVQKNDKLVGEAVSGGRKSYGNLAASLEKLCGRLSGDALSDAYVVNRALSDLGFAPYAAPAMLTKAHPDVKPPKVKGRKPKG